MSDLTTANMSTKGLEVMERAYKFSEIIAQSDIIPVHYRGKPANVFIAVQSALRMNFDPMLVMQNTFVVSGKLGMNSSFAIALANSSGLFEGGIRYKVNDSNKELKANYTYYDKAKNKMTGTRTLKEIEVTAYATLKSTRQEISFKVAMQQAVADGWISNPKYESLPELMLCYRAATLLIRTHVPEVINGMHMVEEIEDVVAAKAPHASRVTATSKLDEFLSIEEPQIVEQIELQENAHNKLSSLIELHHIPQETVEKWCKKGDVDRLEELDEAKVQSCIEYIESKSRDNNCGVAI